MGRGERDDAGLAVIVMGASAGGVDALSAAVAGLPRDLAAAVLVVLHLSPHGTSVLPRILDARSELAVAHATNGERLEAGRVYVAPPDRHLVVDRGCVRLTSEPRENGVRPAVDTLFRSAAQAYGPDVIGVVLSGTLDDGTAGLVAIEDNGGIGVVQDPAEAVFPGMPTSAVRYADPDHVVPLDKLAPLLVSLVDARVAEGRPHAQTGAAAMSDTEDTGDARAEAQEGDPSEFTCPECGGTLWERDEHGLLRFRCRVGHAYSTESLLAEQIGALERALWGAVVALEERGDMATRLAGRMAARGRSRHARQFEGEAADARQRAGLVKDAIAHLSEPVGGDEIAGRDG